MGLRHCVKAQWLLTDLKQKVSEGSQTEACDIVDKVFESLFTVGQQASRASVINNQNRRRVYLNELGLRDSLVDKAMILPMDKDGKQISVAIVILRLLRILMPKTDNLIKPQGLSSDRCKIIDNHQSSRINTHIRISDLDMMMGLGGPTLAIDRTTGILIRRATRNNASSSRGRGKRHILTLIRKW